jgi:hypothetical protein
VGADVFGGNDTGLGRGRITVGCHVIGTVGIEVGRGVARKVVGADVGDTVGCDEVEKVVGADVGATQ